MKYYLALIFLLIGNFTYAADQLAEPEETSPGPSAALANPLPSLGTCNEYTDYYIYQCMPFKCNLQIGQYEDVYREMETIGYEKDLCIHNIRFIMRNKAFPPAEFNLFCKLSKNGRLEMANLFTRYKKGEIKVYVDTIMSKELKKECNRTKQ